MVVFLRPGAQLGVSGAPARRASACGRGGLLAVAAMGALGCHRESVPLSAKATEAQAAASTSSAIDAPGGAPLPTMPTTGDFKLGPHPRILLTAERLALLQDEAKANPPHWQLLLKNCDEAVTGKGIGSGYQGEDWANATLDLALCGKILKKPAYTKASLRYMQALVDDHDDVGDKKGGDKVARDDDGYAIRNRGFMAAIAYDWLHDEPGMTDEIKKHMIGRFHAFNTWYQKDGYRKDEPWSNHFMGWFASASMAGVATDGDDPRGAEMRKMARNLWSTVIVPGYKRRLEGGDYPEGWQYARLIGAVLGIYIDAEGRSYPGGPEKLVLELPWMRESITFQTHALLPDGKHTFDSGDWVKKPAQPFSHQLFGVAVALPPGDPFAKQALYMAQRHKHDGEPGWNWLAAIADLPTRPIEDPKKGNTSYLAKGTGVVLARTDWKETAGWVSFNSGSFFGDHQHHDQGHFEVVRGDDALLIDPGDYDSYSTQSHNCILVDDKKENDRWSPNQAIYSTDASVARFEDAGGVVYAHADYTTAWNPDEYPRYKKTRSVSRAERDFIFSRNPVTGMPGAGNARVVVYDRITVSKPTYAVSWAGHSSVKPEVTGPNLRIGVGKSSAWVTTLLPSGATATLLAEPTVVNPPEVYLRNEVAEGITSTRFEIPSPKGKTEHRFLHTVVTGATGQKPPAATRIEGEGLEGAALDTEAYLFPTAAPQRIPAAVSYKAPETATRHIVTGLAPGSKYVVTAKKEGALCTVALLPGGSVGASGAGVIRLEVVACVPTGPTGAAQ